MQTCCQSFVSITAREGTSSAIGLYVTCFYVGGSFGGLIPGLLWTTFGRPATVALILAMLTFMAMQVRFAWSKT